MEKEKEKGLIAYIIDLGIQGLADVRKCVTFINGVGILDHAGVATHRPDIYGPGDGGKYPRPSGQYANFDLVVLADYFSKHGAKVSEITEANAETFRRTLKAGKLPPAKYLIAIAPVEARSINKMESGDSGNVAAVEETDLEETAKDERTKDDKRGRRK